MIPYFRPPPWRKKPGITYQTSGGATFKAIQ